MMSGEEIGFNRNGFYLASDVIVAWDAIYAAAAKSLFKKGIVEDDAVHDADKDALESMVEALGCPKQFVAVSLAGT